jgi:hypothetical protein
MSASAAGNTFMVMGKVSDRNGNPVVGAVVTLIDGIYIELGTTTTDQNGNFEFPNIVSKSDTCKVYVKYFDGATEYKILPTEVPWYSTQQAIVQVDPKVTQFVKYPPPEYGYIWGFIQTDTSSGRTLDGVVYAVSPNNEQKYYTFADRSGGNGQYTFYLPKGTYYVYAQHEENGVIYQSPKRVPVTVEGNSYQTDVNPTLIIIPLTNPIPNPDPSYIPDKFTNKINGTVKTKDGKPYSDAIVSLYQKSDDGSRFIKKDQYIARTDANGYYEFYGVGVTSDSGIEVAGSKNFMINVEYTDNTGVRGNISEMRPLYYPNTIMSFNMEQSARNLTVNFSLPYAKSGWVNINSDPAGSRLSVDGKPLLDGDGKQYTTPCTAYIDAGKHEVKLSYDGYSDKTFTIEMEENKEHQAVFASLDKSIVPSWTPVVVAALILIAVAGITAFMLFQKKHIVMGPLNGTITSMKHKYEDMKANSEISKAHKAEAAEQRRIELQQKAAQKRESQAAAAKQSHTAPKKIEDKKILPDVKSIGNIASSLPKIGGGKPASIDREEYDEKPTVAFASDIYKRPDTYTGLERIANKGSTNLPAKQQEPDVRLKVPKTPPVKETATTTKDKERIIRYIKEHSDGVSFIQMSNDLEITPNNLTIMMKELVINDDVEKVKGLYYYKSHDQSLDDGKSSVVVWRLDGDK